MKVRSQLVSAHLSEEFKKVMGIFKILKKLKDGRYLECVHACIHLEIVRHTFSGDLIFRYALDVRRANQSISPIVATVEL